MPSERPLSGSLLALGAVALLSAAGALGRRGGVRNVDQVDDFEDDEFEIEPQEQELEWHDLSCEECGGDLTPLGSLGSKHWFRCRACGLDQPRDA